MLPCIRKRLFIRTSFRNENLAPAAVDFGPTAVVFYYRSVGARLYPCKEYISCLLIVISFRCCRYEALGVYRKEKNVPATYNVCLKFIFYLCSPWT